MTLIASCDHWYLRLQALRESFTILQIMVTEDHPKANNVALVEIISHPVDDMLGWLDEALEAGKLLQHAVLQNDPAQTRQYLAASQGLFERVMRTFFADLASYARMADLSHLGRSRGGLWRQWTVSVRRTVEAHHLALLEANQACFTCWMELTERYSTESLLLPEPQKTPAKRRKKSDIG